MSGERGTSIQERIAQFEADADFFQQRREELTRQFPDRWVAVFRGQVVAVDADLRQLLGKLDGQGLPRGQVYFQYLTTGDTPLIVTAR